MERLGNVPEEQSYNENKLQQSFYELNNFSDWNAECFPSYHMLLTVWKNSVLILHS
jgi:hypothetical protein